MKKCTKCKTEKTHSEFNKDAQRWDGLQASCRACKRGLHQEYIKRDKTPVQSKVCAECKTEKSASDFYTDKAIGDGLNRLCIDCNGIIKKSYYADNRADLIAASRAYETDPMNHNKVRAWKANGRARRRTDIGDQRLPSGHLEALINWYGNQCMYPGCERTDLTFDHVVPLTKSGAHSLANGQLLCHSHNSSKGNKNSNDYRDRSKGILVDSFGR